MIKIPIYHPKTVQTYIELSTETPLYFRDQDGNQYKLNRYCLHKLFKNGGYCHYSFEELENGELDFSGCKLFKMAFFAFSLQ